jgi:hypothetical protein
VRFNVAKLTRLLVERRAAVNLPAPIVKVQ